MFEMLASLLAAAIAIVVLVAGARAVATQVTVFEYQRGLLYRRGQFLRMLGPGRHRLWRPFLQESVTLFDMRLRSVVFGGQEVPTRDQISVKATVITQFRVIDPVAATHKLESYADFLHQETQIALRTTVASLTLEQLFESRADLTSTLTQAVQQRCAEYGLAVQQVAVRDLILPGEIKAALGRVIDAEKSAKAALVTAREELAVARTQANTARVLQENPLALRLKELQTLAEIGRTPGNTIVCLPGSDVAQLLRASTPSSPDTR